VDTNKKIVPYTPGKLASQQRTSQQKQQSATHLLPAVQKEDIAAVHEFIFFLEDIRDVISDEIYPPYPQLSTDHEFTRQFGDGIYIQDRLYKVQLIDGIKALLRLLQSVLKKEGFPRGVQKSTTFDYVWAQGGFCTYLGITNLLLGDGMSHPAPLLPMTKEQRQKTRRQAIKDMCERFERAYTYYANTGRSLPRSILLTWDLRGQRWPSDANFYYYTGSFSIKDVGRIAASIIDEELERLEQFDNALNGTLRASRTTAPPRWSSQRVRPAPRRPWAARLRARPRRT